MQSPTKPSVAAVLLADVNGPGHPDMIRSITDREIRILQWMADNRGTEEVDAAVEVMHETLQTMDDIAHMETRQIHA